MLLVDQKAKAVDIEKNGNTTFTIGCSQHIPIVQHVPIWINFSPCTVKSVPWP